MNFAQQVNRVAFMHEQHHIIIPSPNPLPIEQAVEALKASLLQYAAATVDAPMPKGGALRVFRQDITAVDPLKWLGAQSLFPRIFWMNREQDYLTAAIGAADTITHEGAGSNDENFRRLGNAMAGKSPHARYFGGFRFTAPKLETRYGKLFPRSPSRSPFFRFPEKALQTPLYVTSGPLRPTELRQRSKGLWKLSTSWSPVPENRTMSFHRCFQSPTTQKGKAG